MYKDIFDEIISIMHHDYSGVTDKQGWDKPDDFRDNLNKNMELYSADDFVEFVKDYLIDFNDNHIHFMHTKQENGSELEQVRGFKVRRFEEKLYVTSVTNKGSITKGNTIMALDGIPILKLRERYKRYLNENHAERENWNPHLLKHKTCTIMNDDGTTVVVEMETFDRVPAPPTYSIEKMIEGPLLVTFTDFADPDTISSLIRDNEDLLGSAESLIVDVRINNGGSDASYFELLPYLFPDGEKDFFDPELHTMLYNCTERTCDLQVRLINEKLPNIEDEQTKTMFNLFKTFFEKNHGKGFVEFGDEGDNTAIIKGKKTPEKVIVLSDVYCGSAGDSFVENTKLSDKVTVIGRATAGLNDYTNLTIMKWEEGFELWYPTSKLKRVDDGKGMTGIGIAPDIYIPWTPQHIHEDVDMKQALALLAEIVPIANEQG
ncbi:S41 family peptidase [Sporosarcina sp. G11-34]|uniref:S41 family peptidase n=1 Tax=Sporosarcina sp. G11-34 TaxID=2849605 RepID=UPI0022A91266|nr:S41 family peptidase [Sporosarcina sp. G11-34]MCZ2256868.1 hypothetical protein [Sporosarcina sp. G11-34]